MNSFDYSIQAKRIAWVAVGLWFIALALPVFITDRGLSRMIGLEVLLAGIFLGWGVGGWAAYANILFAVVANKVLRNNGSARVLCAVMILLALTVPMFEGPILSEADMATQPVASWGWAALIWGLSISLLAVAVWLEDSDAEKTLALGVCAVFVVIACAVLFVRTNQIGKANIQEKELYLPASMAFTLNDFCGVPFNWPSGPLVTSNDHVAIEIDPTMTDLLLVPVPQLAEPIIDGYRWVSGKKISPFTPEIKVGYKPAMKEAFRLKVESTDDGALIRLFNPLGVSVYEQPLRLRKSKMQFDQYCPYSSFGPSTATYYKGHFDALAVALSPILSGSQVFNETPAEEVKGARVGLSDQVAKRCVTNGDAGVNKSDTVFTLDGRTVRIPNYGGYASFCSRDYLALTFVIAPQKAAASDLNATVYVYDRVSLRPLAEFKGRNGCASTGSCAGGLLPSQVIGLEISDNAVSVKTESGDTRTNRTL